MLTDLIAAWHHLRRSPVHVLVVTLSLGIGMAVAVAAFSIVDALVFAGVPGIVDRANLVRVRWGSEQPIGFDDFTTLEARRGGAFTTWAADRLQLVPVLPPTGAVTLTGAFVSSAYFETLGTIAVRGRLLTQDDARAEAAPSVVIGERLWRDSYGSAEDVLGRVLTVSGRPFTIVGVTPSGFPGLLPRDVGQSRRGYPEIWLPLHTITAGSIQGRAAPGLSVAGRLRPGATLAQAQAELAVAAPQLNGPPRTTPEARRLVSFRAGLSWTERPFETILTLAVFLFVPLSILLIGCANAINLQLARATERSRELGVRIALGASRYRLARLLAVEVLFLAALAASTGWYGAVLFLDRAAPIIQLPVQIDLASALFMLFLIVTVIVVAGFAPAWLATRTAIAAGLKEVADGSIQHKRLRATLVVAQVAISLSLLLISARGVRTLQVWLPQLPPSADRTLVAEFNVATVHPGQRDSRAFVDAVLSRLDRSVAIPSVGFADFVRMDGAVRYWRASDNDEARRSAVGGFVTRGWFDAYGAPLTGGRIFSADGRGEIVINDAFAATLDGGVGDALGRTLRISHPPGAPPQTVEIVGVVADRLTQMDGRGVPAIYALMPEHSPPGVVLVARAPDVAAATAAIKVAVTEADSALPWFSLETLETRALAPVQGLRETAWFGAALGAVALLLAATGLHAVLTYMIRRRTHEIGIRMAVGAGTHAIVLLVVGHAARLLVGGAIGAVVISAPLVLVMRVLPNLSPFDPIAILAPLGLLFVVGVLASILPAYRAATVNPIDVLHGRDV
jgi:putative ABC transport system permease protein